MKKRLLAMLLCLSITLMLMTTVTYAMPTEYDLWVNNERITSTNLTVQCGSGTAVYDPMQNTLTLTNAEITNGCEQDYLYSGIISYLPELEIVIVGDGNTITNTGGEGISTYQTDPDTYKCIRHDLTVSSITGGKLTIVENTEWYGYGIYCTGDLTLDGVTLDIDSAASGLWSQWKLDITNCVIEIDTAMNGIVTNAGGTAASGDNGRGDITVANSDLDIIANGGNSNGILIAGSDTVGSLKVDSGNIKINAVAGILCKDSEGESGSVTVNGGSLDITASGNVTDLDSFTLNNGEQIIRGTLGGKSCLIAIPVPLTAVDLSTNMPFTGRELTAMLTPAAGRANYQWYTNSTAEASESTAIDGATSSSYIPVAADKGKYLYVVATGIGGSEGSTASAVTTYKVAVYTEAEFDSLTANGSENETTTELTLTFDQDITGLTASNITVTGATKGTLTKTDGQIGVYKLTISDITVGDGENVGVAVAKDGYSITPANKTVAVRIYTPPWDDGYFVAFDGDPITDAVKVKVTAKESCVLVFAAYSADGQMAGVSITTVEALSVNKDYTPQSGFNENGVVKIKAILLKDGNIAPLCKSI